MARTGGAERVGSGTAAATRPPPARSRPSFKVQTRAMQAVRGLAGKRHAARGRRGAGAEGTPPERAKSRQPCRDTPHTLDYPKERASIRQTAPEREIRRQTPQHALSRPRATPRCQPCARQHAHTRYVSTAEWPENGAAARKKRRKKTRKKRLARDATCAKLQSQMLPAAASATSCSRSKRKSA